MNLRALLAVALLLVAAAPDEAALYHYRADVGDVTANVYDGDTVTADIDLGLGVWQRGAKLRLLGINAPEVRGPERPRGLKSRDHLRGMLKGRMIIVETDRDKRGKYGRLLATLWVLGVGDWCPTGIWCNANAQMVVAGHAEWRNY